MFKTIALKWEYRIGKSRFDTILLESYFGRMLRESDEVHVLRSEDSCECHTFFFTDKSYLRVILNRDVIPMRLDADVRTGGESSHVTVTPLNNGDVRILLDSNFSFETASKKMTLKQFKDFLVDCQYALEKAEERRK